MGMNIFFCIFLITAAKTNHKNRILKNSIKNLNCAGRKMPYDLKKQNLMNKQKNNFVESKIKIKEHMDVYKSKKNILEKFKNNFCCEPEKNKNDLKNVKEENPSFENKNDLNVDEILNENKEEKSEQENELPSFENKDSILAENKDLNVNEILIENNDDLISSINYENENIDEIKNDLKSDSNPSFE